MTPVELVTPVAPVTLVELVTPVVSPVTNLTTLFFSALSPHSFFPNPFLPDLASFAPPTISSLIADCFSSSLKIKKVGCNNLKKPKDASYDIHSLTTLEALLEEKKKNHERPDLRFLLDLNKNAWFVRETHTHFPAPAHYQMTGESGGAACCITAGNLFLISDYKTLVKINNKSGDFRPSFDSLKWFIAILILNEKRLSFSLPEILLVEELNSSGGVKRTLEWDVEKLREWVLQVFTDEKILSELQQQSKGIKKIIYIKEPEFIMPPFFNLGAAAKDINCSLSFKL